MATVSDVFEHGRVVCRNCGHMNDFGSGKSLFHAELRATCSRCGFCFLEHIERQMHKLLEMMEISPTWNAWFRNGQNDLIKKHLDRMVPPPSAA